MTFKTFLNSSLQKPTLFTWHCTYLMISVPGLLKLPSLGGVEGEVAMMFHVTDILNCWPEPT
jgi:hypothetical protein